MSLLGPRATTTHPSPCPLGGCYSDFMDLPPHSCFLTWEWISVSAKGYHCLFLYVAWPYPPRTDFLGQFAAPLVFGSTNGVSGGCQWVSRPSGTSIESTAYPIRLEERHGSAGVLPSPAGTPCERGVPGCPHRTRVCCDSRKENWKQALETGCPFRDWVRMATPRHCMGLLQWCPPQAKRLPISGLPWSAHGAAGTCFPGEHFHCGYGVPWWHKKCWRACCFHQHGPRKAVSRVWAPCGREVHTHLSRWTGTIVCCFSEVTSICPACF